MSFILVKFIEVGILFFGLRFVEGIDFSFVVCVFWDFVFIGWKIYVCCV